MSEIKKCIIWDLDNTIWDGISLEGKVHIRNEVRQTIKELDDRGILHSIASRGEEDVALKTLEKYKLEHFFLVPKINWLPKYFNIKTISDELGIALDSMVFIDDDVFELEQMSFMIPEIHTIQADKASELPEMSIFSPTVITNESKNRRAFYKSEQKRTQAEASHLTREAFLKSCCMKLKIEPIRKMDASRVLELSTRTHQLNTTGRIFHESELNDIMLSKSETMKIVTAALNDKFGSYGIIGVAIIETIGSVWRLIYLAISCRVMGRGIERALLTRLIYTAKVNGFKYVEATLRETGKNKMMRALYQMMGFQKWRVCKEDQLMIFRANINSIPKSPQWVEIV